MERRMRSALLVPMFAVGMLLAGDLTTAWAGTPYADAVLADSPVVYWSFNDATTNTTTPDLTANGRTLYYMSNGAAMPPPNGGQTTAPGQPGLLCYQGNKACFFNGNLNAGNGDTPNGGAVWSGDAPPPNPDYNPHAPQLQFSDYVTIEAWIMDTSSSTPGANNSSGRRIVSTVDLTVGVQAGRLWLTTLAKKDYFAPSGSVTADTWTHVAVVWENNYDALGHSRATFYINGANAGVDTVALTGGLDGMRSSAYDMVGVGRRRIDGQYQQWLGYIDELAVYHAKLTAEQILEHYNASPLPPQPAVTLGMTGSPMTEAGGQATVTASLSWAYTNDVTVYLAFSGTATLTSDYTRTATNIVIPAGSTSGSVTLTAVPDIVPEIPDETVVVDIASVVNGTNGSPTQVTATIADIDSLVVPAVTLSVTGSPMPEAWGKTIVTANLSKTFPYGDVTVGLAFSGTATPGTDYTRTASNIVISAGSTNGSITLTAIRDLIAESPDETVVVTVASVVNATNGSPSQVTVTIADGGLIQPRPRSIGITFGDGSQGPAPTVLAGSVRQQHFWNAATWEDHWQGYYGPSLDYGWVPVATKADDGSVVNVQYQNYWATYSGTCTAKGVSQGTGSDPYLQTQGILMTCDQPDRPENENVFSGIPFSIYDVYVSKNGVVTNYPYQSGGAWKGLGLWHEYSIQFIQFVASAPYINNEPGPKISDDGVETWLGGTLVHTGAPPTSVWVYWGMADGGTNATSWGHTNYFGVNSNVVPASYALELRYLPINTMFHYRYYAECPEGGGVWAPSTADFRSGGGTAIIIR